MNSITPEFAVFNPSCHGVWRNSDISFGYKLFNRREVHHWFWRVTIIYDFAPIVAHPLYFERSDGMRIAAPAISGTDQASVPPIAQAWLPEDGILGAYTHDAAARYGGLLFAAPGEMEWTFRRVKRHQSDELLRTTAQCDPVGAVGKYRAWAVKESVVLARYKFHDWQHGDDVPTLAGHVRAGSQPNWGDQCKTSLP